MTYEITERHEPERTMVVSRFEATPEEISDHAGGALRAVYSWLGQHGVPPVGPPIGCYEPGDGPFVVRMGCIVAEPITADDGVEPFVLPERTLLSTLHVGPYEGLQNAYAALQQYAHEHGRDLDPTIMWEEYLTGPEVPSEETRTLVHWPVID